MLIATNFNHDLISNFFMLLFKTILHHCSEWNATHYIVQGNLIIVCRREVFNSKMVIAQDLQGCTNRAPDAFRGELNMLFFKIIFNDLRHRVANQSVGIATDMLSRHR